MPKIARLWIVFAAAAAVLSLYVTPPAGVGILAGLALFLDFERPHPSRWFGLARMFTLLLTVLVFGLLIQEYIGGDWKQAFGWMVPVWLLGHGVKWIGATPQTRQPPQE